MPLLSPTSTTRTYVYMDTWPVSNPVGPRLVQPKTAHLGRIPPRITQPSASRPLCHHHPPTISLSSISHAVCTVTLTLGLTPWSWSVLKPFSVHSILPLPFSRHDLLYLSLSLPPRRPSQLSRRRLSTYVRLGMAMASGGTVCSMCGDVGFPDKLFRCARCRRRFQHSYALLRICLVNFYLSPY